MATVLAPRLCVVTLEECALTVQYSHNHNHHSHCHSALLPSLLTFRKGILSYNNHNYHHKITVRLVKMASQGTRSFPACHPPNPPGYLKSCSWLTAGKASNLYIIPGLPGLFQTFSRHALRNQLFTSCQLRAYRLPAESSAVASQKQTS